MVNPFPFFFTLQCSYALAIFWNYIFVTFFHQFDLLGDVKHFYMKAMHIQLGTQAFSLWKVVIIVGFSAICYARNVAIFDNNFIPLS